MNARRVLDGDRGYRYVSHSDPVDVTYSIQTWTALGFAFIYGLHLVVKHFDLVILTPAELLWNAIVYVVPVGLLSFLTQISGMAVDFDQKASQAQSKSEINAVKSEALRQVLRLGPTIWRSPLGLQGSIGLQAASSSTTNKPPGLGNWDNSCYQNSILQGLSSLPTFAAFLDSSMPLLGNNTSGTTGSLHTLTRNLTSTTNNGKRIWTPAKLKSMSSWQQQDAQEYYSRVLDDVEQDLKKGLSSAHSGEGLETVDKIQHRRTMPLGDDDAAVLNPLEGLLGQRVTCASCGYSEGLTLQPFNCLTLSLGAGPRFSLESLLDQYTDLEEIEGVECLSCTFKRQEQRLQTLLQGASLPKEVQQQIAGRLQCVQQTIEDADFTDQAFKKCAVTKDAKVSSTKTKQVVLARPPKSLAIHVNRSIFDEMTGGLRKNLAFVAFSKYLSLKPWILGYDRKSEQGPVEQWPTSATQSMVTQHHGLPHKSPADYVLRAVVTHQGRHENGHYICYRQHCTDVDEKLDKGEGQKKEEVWWRLSDDDVTQATEQEVFRQGGVFMLFYERLSGSSDSSSDSQAEVAMPEASSVTVAENVTPTPDSPASSVAANIEGIKTDKSAIAVPIDAVENHILPEAAVKPLPLSAEGGATTTSCELGAEPEPVKTQAQLNEHHDEDQASRGKERKQLASTPPPQKLRTSRGVSRKASKMSSSGMPALTAQ